MPHLSSDKFLIIILRINHKHPQLIQAEYRHNDRKAYNNYFVAEIAH